MSSVSRKKEFFIIFLFSLCVSLPHWFILYCFENIPFDLLPLFRFDEPQYYQVIRIIQDLPQFNTFAPMLDGHPIFIWPVFYSVLPAAILDLLFGHTFGILLTDVFSVFLFIYFLYLLVKSCSPSCTFSSRLFLTFMAFFFIYFPSKMISPHLGFINIAFLKFPRPLVSNVYWIGFCYFFVKATEQEKQDYKVYLTLALFNGLLFQAHGYLAVWTTGVVALWLFLQAFRDKFRKTLLFGSLYSSVFLFLSLPFFYQRAMGTKEIFLRNGEQKTATSMDQVFHNILSLKMLITLVLLLVLLWAYKTKFFKPRKVLPAILLLVSAPISFVLFFTLYKKSSISFRSHEIFYHSIDFVALWILFLLWEKYQTTLRFDHFFARFKKAPVVILALSILSFDLLFKKEVFSDQNYNYKESIRTSLVMHYRILEMIRDHDLKDYKSDFIKLNTFLRENLNENDSVGTNDDIVQYWWPYSHGGLIVTPDSWINTAPMTQVEDTLISMYKVIGGNEHDFIQFIRKEHVHFLDNVKYYNFKHDQFSGADDYSDDEKKQVQKMGVWDVHYFVPKSILEQMEKRYIEDNYQVILGDYYIFLKTKAFKDAFTNPYNYPIVFENSSYIVLKTDS